MLSNTHLADLFTNLPQEITIDILSRLPVRSITRCKCVCKSWRDLIKSSFFVTTHHSKSSSTSSSSGLVFIEDITSSKPYKICDEVGATISNFGLPTHHHTQDPRPMPRIESCANGLLLLFDGSTNLFICNPITREYILLPPPPRYNHMPCTAKFGFGVSKVTGQYKVIIFNNEACIYSLEIGLWRSINYNTTRLHGYATNGASAAALVNGNLHWLGRDDDFYHDNHQLRISCFDLETEQFTFFSFPPRDYVGGCMLSALEGGLCLCDNVDNDNKIVIWLMRKYGDEGSWTKEFIINRPSFLHHLNFAFLFPVKVFRDSGDILFGRDSCGKLFFYSNDTKTIQECGHVQVCGSYSSKVVNYTPSFLSLKTMGFQNVASF